MMKAIEFKSYGGPEVIELNELPLPVPKDYDILVKIQAAGVNTADWHTMNGQPQVFRLATGIPKPKNTRLGADIAGVVEAVGAKVTRFQSGDAVFGDLSSSGFGGFAEYVAAPEAMLAIKPANLTFEQAAAVPMSAMTALQALRDLGQVRAGQRVLINGASGGVGSYAIQIAKAFGAEVTAVCSRANLDKARELGADQVIDYTQENFTQRGEHYDVILGANGYHHIREYQRALTPTGIYVMSGGTWSQIFQAVLLGPFYSRRNGKQAKALSSVPVLADLEVLTAMIESGSIVPRIDRRFPLSETAAALGYLGTGHAQGKIVVVV